MCRDTVAHVLFPDKEIIDGARWAVVARHGHTFAVDKLVDMAGKEPDKPAAVELFPARCHIELVWASVDNHAIHFFLLVGAGQSLLVTAPAPRSLTRLSAYRAPAPATPGREI